MIPMESPLSHHAAHGQTRNARSTTEGETSPSSSALPLPAEDVGGEFELLIAENPVVAGAGPLTEIAKNSPGEAPPKLMELTARPKPDTADALATAQANQTPPTPETAEAGSPLKTTEPVELPGADAASITTPDLVPLDGATTSPAVPVPPLSAVAMPAAETPQTGAQATQINSEKAAPSTVETTPLKIMPEGQNSSNSHLPPKLAVRDVPQVEMPAPKAGDANPISRLPTQPITSEIIVPAIATAPSGFPGLQALTSQAALDSQRGEGLESTTRQLTELSTSKPDTARAPLPPAADARSITAQVATAIVKADGGKLDIRLDPPELGRLSVTISSAEGTASAVIAADRAETQDLLRRHADLLQRALRDAGYADVKLDFSTSSENGPRGEGTGDFQSPESHAEHPAKTEHYLARASVSGLDIRL